MKLFSFWLKGLLLLPFCILAISSGCRSGIASPPIAPTFASTQESVRVTEEEVPFESLARGDNSYSSGYEATSPGMAIASQRREIGRLVNSLSRNFPVVPSSMGPYDYLVLAAYQGKKGTNMYGIEITRVTKVGANEIRLYTHFTERDPQLSAGDIVTSPYHLVRIPRDGLGGEVTFVLYEDGEEILREKHIIAPPPNEVILPKIYNSDQTP